MLGTLLGLGAATRIAQVAAVRAGQADLRDYARQLQQVALQLNDQSLHAISSVNNDHKGFCSEDELSFMRGLVYNSSQIKDIGRVKERTFYCSSETGVVAEPFQVPKPNFVFRNTRVYVWIPIMFGEKARG